MPKNQSLPPQPAPSGKPHQLILEDRERLSVTGVLRMLRCEETAASMDTSRGTLTLQGQGLNVRRLSLETGEVTLEGRVDSILYTERLSARSFWQKLVR